uniref:hypothetical protein n=1 Tax=Haloprofundus halophilus TaxID=2283527 RepID=UPI000E437A43
MHVEDEVTKVCLRILATPCALEVLLQFVWKNDETLITCFKSEFSTIVEEVNKSNRIYTEIESYLAFHVGKEILKLLKVEFAVFRPFLLSVFLQLTFEVLCVDLFEIIDVVWGVSIQLVPHPSVGCMQ